ncbi:heparan-alpha-glucosaminide N-acetyltransferase domain-containing protein [Agrococcus sp. BE272]|uniref:heparan-alpha-glucosaminide N-acetyltransferase domain-containing protein n=1 Tax=Agrococcus sp. BE272 TaxID=2817727 RepID=UPI002862DD4B|nr:heparan-alpha-glucosaminide N-acetyltransferase domain-containing protein [Agrococcus sp. BE272]MDR7233066.1 putative membrane protein [Agrococcus sp. BE272]
MSGSERLVGVDLARLLAVVGMMAAHTLLVAEPPPPDAVAALVDGPPSTLFAVLGGVSVVLAARARLAAGDRWGALRSTLVRGALVALLGAIIGPFAAAVYVVLVPFGVAIMLAAVLVLLPSWLLAGVTTVLWLAGGSLLVAARERLPSAASIGDGAALGERLAATAADVLLTGVYPVLTWVAYLLVGVLAARALLAARARDAERGALVQLAAVGAALVVAGVAASELGIRLLAGPLDDAARDELLRNGYGAAQGSATAWQLVAAPHTGTPADMARTVGIALLVIALLGLLAAALPRPAVRALEPLRAAGAAPLTIYVVHVLLLTAMLVPLQDAAPALGAGWAAWAVQVVVALAIGAALAAGDGRGPLERVVGRAADRAAGDRPRPEQPAADRAHG